MNAEILLALLDRAQLDPSEALQRLLAPCLLSDAAARPAVQTAKRPEPLAA